MCFDPYLNPHDTSRQTQVAEGWWARKNCWRVLEFSRSWPQFPQRLAWGWGGGVPGCRRLGLSLPRVRDPSQAPHKEAARHRGAGGLFGWGTSSGPRRRAAACGCRARTPRARRATVRPGSGGDPGRSGYLPWRGGGGVLPGLLIATRRAHCGEGPQLLDPASPLYLGLPLPRAASRREGIRPKIGTLQLFFSTTWP